MTAVRVCVPLLTVSLLLLVCAPGVAEEPSNGFRYVDAFGDVHHILWQPTPNWRPPPRLPPSELVKPKALPAHASRSELTPLHYWPLIREAAIVYTLPEALLYAVMLVESGFDAGAVSRVGAMGLMQLMPATAAEMGVRDPFDPRENALGGARYLRVLTNQFDGDLLKTIAAYNAGPGAVVEHMGVPPFPETRRYVTRVLKVYHSQSRILTQQRLARR